jgi:hypothetical protein
MVPLTRWSLVSLWKTLLRIGTRAGVAYKSLPLELPLLGIHLLALIVDYNSTVLQSLEARIDIGHQLQLKTIIQSLQKAMLLVRVFHHLIRSIT